MLGWDGQRSLYRSQDGGRNWWHAVDSGLPAGANAMIRSGNRLIAGLIEHGVWRSENSGAYWQESNKGISSPVRLNSLALAGEQPVVWAASDSPRGGLFRSPDGGISWTTILSDTRLLSVGVEPSGSATTCAGGSAGLYCTLDGQRWARLVGGNVTSVAVAPGAEQVLCGVDNLTTDEGLICEIEFLPNGDAIIGFRRPHGARGVTAVAFLAGQKFATGLATDGLYQVWRSDLSDAGYGSVLQSKSYLRELASDPRSPQVIYAASHEGVYISADGGSSWRLRPAETGMGLSGALAVDALGMIYVGNWGFESIANGGVYSWNASQNAWMLSGLEDEGVISLAARNGDAPRLYAGTRFGDFWRLALPIPQRTWLNWISR
jgi:hypothetical protein